MYDESKQKPACFTLFGGKSTRAQVTAESYEKGCTAVLLSCTTAAGAPNSFLLRLLTQGVHSSIPPAQQLTFG